MTYGIGLGFPVEPTEKDIKKIKRDLAYDKFGVVNGGKTKSKPADTGKTKHASKKDFHHTVLPLTLYELHKRTGQLIPKA